MLFDVVIIGGMSSNFLVLLAVFINCMVSLVKPTDLLSTVMTMFLYEGKIVLSTNKTLHITCIYKVMEGGREGDLHQ